MALSDEENSKGKEVIRNIRYGAPHGHNQQKTLRRYVCGESLHAVNYMMSTSAKQFSRQIKAKKNVDKGEMGAQEISNEQVSVAINNTRLLESMRKRGVRIIL